MAHWTDTFAPEDLEEVAAFLKATNRTQYDPNADGRNPDDVFFWLTREQIGLQTYAMREARNRAGRSFRCYPMIIESPHPNAFARELDRVHVVGLNAGMATVAFELAAYALSRNDTFAGIGDPSEETNPPLPTGAMLGYWIFDRVAAGHVQEADAGSELIPRDPTRKFLVHALSHLLMRFAWFHEVFHCLNGHCALLRASGFTPELHEMPTDRDMDLIATARGKIGNVDAGRMLRAFEFDADSCAMRTMITLQLTDAEPMTPFDEQPLPTRLRLVIAASWLMTFLFSQSNMRLTTVSSGSHPAPEDRLRNLLCTLFAGELQTRDDMPSAMPQVLDDLERFSAHAGILWPIGDLTSQAGAVDRYDLCWNKLGYGVTDDLEIIRRFADSRSFRILS